MASFSLGSPAVDDGGPMPEEYGSTERDDTPPVSTAGVPPGAPMPALVVDDPDATGGHVLAGTTLEGTDAP